MIVHCMKKISSPLHSPSFVQHIRRTCLLSLLLILGGVVSAHATDILIVQSASLQPYLDARKGFIERLAVLPRPTAGPKSIVRHTSSVLVLEEETDQTSQLTSAIHQHAPQLLVAIGPRALRLAMETPLLPIVYLLAPNPHLPAVPPRRVTGVSLDVPPPQQLQAFLSVLSFRRVGIIHDPTGSTAFVSMAKESAAALGITVLTREAEHVKEAPGLIKSLAGEVDAIWLIPDLTVLSAENLQYLAYFSLRHNIPILAFSERLLKYGAAVGLELDSEDMGRQAAELAEGILLDHSALPAPQAPRKVTTKRNEGVLKKLGIPLTSPDNVSNSELPPPSPAKEGTSHLPTPPGTESHL